jgi:hypothetical protein
LEIVGWLIARGIICWENIVGWIAGVGVVEHVRVGSAVIAE